MRWRAGREYLWPVANGTISIRVLGPVEAIRNGEPVNLGGRRQRALLALLALAAGRPVPADRLIDELWPGRPPPGTSTLPSYVTRLRASLGGSDAVVAEASGYRLAAAAEQVDARAFEELLRAARAAMARGRARSARDRLDAALSLFVSDGYPQVSIRNIAAKVEYSPGAIYSYFASKETGWSS